MANKKKPRNRNIAGTMFKAGFIDTWGRGFKKIREGFEKAGMPIPKIENFCGGVQVSIERTKFMQMSEVMSEVVSEIKLTQNLLKDRKEYLI